MPNDNYHFDSPHGNVSLHENDEVMKAILEIQNLKCEGCVSTILKKSLPIEGLSDVWVALDDCAVTFTHTTDKALKSAQEALSKLGYPIKGDENPFGNKVKSYVSCAIGKMNKADL